MQPIDADTYDGRPLQIILQSWKPIARGLIAKILVGEAVDRPELVAVKIFENMLDDLQQQLVDRERQMARQISSMRHPYLLRFIGEATVDCRQAIISPYMKNGNLLQYFMANRDVDKKTLILQVAEALHYLHTKPRLVHGNIKCANVLVSDFGNALLSDVGLITSVEKPQTSTTTGTDLRMLCTLRFAAPEILLDTAGDGLRLRSKTCQSDVYAFGMLILEAVTERVPWFGYHDYAVIQRVCSGQMPEQPTVDGIRASVSHAWWNVCRSCCAIDPGDRPSMKEVKSKLEAHELKPVKEFSTGEMLTSVAYAPGGAIRAYTRSGGFQLWEADSGLVATPAIPGGQHHKVVSPDGLQVAYCGSHTRMTPWLERCCSICSADATSASDSAVSLIRLWDLSSGAFRPPLSGHTELVTCLSYSSDGTCMASASYDGTVRLWNTSTAAEIGVLDLVKRPQRIPDISDMVCSPDGAYVAVASRSMAWLWDTAADAGSWPSGKATQLQLKGDSEIQSMRFSPDGSHLFTVVKVGRGSWRGKKSVRNLSKWNAATQTEEFCVETEDDYSVLPDPFHPNGFGIAVSPSGKYLALRNQTIQLRDAATGEPAGLPLPGRWCSLAFSPDGKSMATASWRGNLWIWDIVE